MRSTAPQDANELEALETREWLESLDYVLQSGGPARVGRLLHDLGIHARRHGVRLPFTANTPYINTIPPEEQPPFPGNREIERRIKSLVRWNALAMVVRGEQARGPASAATSRPTRRWPRSRGRRSTTSSAARATTTRRPDLLPGPRLARHLRPRVSRRPARPRSSSRTSAASCAGAAACRRIRIRG